MFKKRLLWQVYPFYIIIIAVSLLIVSVYTSSRIKHFYTDETKERLTANAMLLKKILPSDGSGSPLEIDKACKELGAIIGNRVTFISPIGKVLGDSQHNPEQMNDHSGRPEIVQALQGKIGYSKRVSDTLKKNMLYVAIPVMDDNTVTAVIRTSVSISNIENTLSDLNKAIFRVSLVVLAVILIFSYISYRKISKPLYDLTKAARRFATGNLEHKVVVDSGVEINTLASAMNKMASRLDQTIKDVTNQRNQQDAVLTSMTEGVLAVDMDQNIILLNDAAAEFILTEEITKKDALGRNLREIVRNTELQQFVENTLKSEAKLQGRIIIHYTPSQHPPDRHLQAHGTILRDTKANYIGALIVLNDITQLRMLERIRKDFVANVSHELKTPVTSIKGFVETILGGEVGDAERTRFLQIIARQATRLEAIIDDLLTLSQVEQQKQSTEIELKPGKIKKVLVSAAELCQKKADERDVSLDIDCPDELSANINAPLLEQAMVNLIDNAIKYSDPDSRVEITARQNAQKVIITVKDYGCGIEKQYLPRLFERFYRVDKARSRKLGGTGLGLAIVKHIAAAHNAEVIVKSKPGQGSSFMIEISA